MTKTKLFAAAVVLTSIIATPVLAQGSREQSQGSAQIKTQKMTSSSMRPSERRVARDRAANVGYDRGFNDRRYGSTTGFFPFDVATGIVGGAVGTAGAIVAAPFGGPGGWDNGYNRVGYNDGYSRNYRGSYASINDYPRVGAFATAPNNNPYDLNRVGRAAPFAGQAYAQRNGFVCVPGTVFTNLNGIRTICQ